MSRTIRLDNGDYITFAEILRSSPGSPYNATMLFQGTNLAGYAGEGRQYFNNGNGYFEIYSNLGRLEINFHAGSLTALYNAVADSGTDYTYFAVDSNNLFSPLFKNKPDNGKWHAPNLNKTFDELFIDSEVTDPYEPGGYSEPSVPEGTFTDGGDEIDFPDEPSLSASAAGMVKIFNPTSSELSSFANYLWVTLDTTSLKRLFSDPMDAIVSLAILPVQPSISASKEEIKVGNIGTSVNAYKVTSQYKTVDCGSLTIPKYYGSALDHAGYTKYMIYLPYIGTHEISADDIAGKTVNVKYIIDVLSGACVAFIKCDGTLLYQFSGSCLVQIPISARDFGGVVSGALQIAGAGAALAATGGMSAPISGAVAAGAAMTLANNAINCKPRVQYSGSMGGAAGLMGFQTPYLIRERPRQSLAKGFNKIEGYPSNISAKIGDLVGFTKIEKVHLENIPATDVELNELESILKEGIII